MDKEMNALLSPSRWVKIIASPERKFATWIGGSIVASLSSFQNMWVTKQDYEECGPSIVRQMCNR
jgi:actin-related protein